MGHSTSSGRTAAFSPEAERALNSEGSLVDRLNAYNRAMDEADRNRVSSAAERRAALSFNQRAQAIRDMTFEEYGNGSRAVIPGVGTATVTQDERGRFTGTFHLDRENVTQRVFGTSTTLRSMEEKVRIQMANRNRRGNA